jgi:hypothetical protein
MKFGVLAGNSHINARIHKMLEEIDSSDVSAFIRKFKSERNEQLFHTYRELIIGAELRRHGFRLRYEQKVLEKTPDWVIVDEVDQVGEILDVVTLHQRRETETDMQHTVSTGEIWSGWVTIPPDHIYSKIEQKANAYADLVSTINKPYIVCMFGEFTACVNPEEVQYVLYDHKGGVFSTTPTLSGVVYFFECSGEYHYFYFGNPTASHPSSCLVYKSEAGLILNWCLSPRAV